MENAAFWKWAHVVFKKPSHYVVTDRSSSSDTTNVQKADLFIFITPQKCPLRLYLLLDVIPNSKVHILYTFQLPLYNSPKYRNLF